VVTTGEPFPSLSAQTSASSLGETLFADSGPQLKYYIEVLGPQPTVTLDLLGSAKLAATGGVEGTSEIYLTVDDGTNYLVAGVNYREGGATPVIDTDFGTGVQAGFDPASFTLQTGGENAASASAYLDPYFFVDPSTPNLAEYSIVVSAGIGNAPATPEPSTWAMMLLGFAGLGFFGYRRLGGAATAT
jgi:hypothetical protein